MKTKHIQMTRGSTYSWTETVRDPVTNMPVDLTGKLVYLDVLADLKAPPVIRLTSNSPAESGRRLGIVLEEQAGATLGQYTVTFVPADTSSLLALGHGDPYFYSTAVVDGAVVTPDIEMSNLDLYPQITVPA